jgi:hypothetical protein
MNKYLSTTTGILCLALISLACSISSITGGGESSSQDATVEALSQSLALTATSDAGATPTQAVDSAATIAAAEAAAAEQVRLAQATEEVVATEVAIETTATEDATLPIRAELPGYRVDPALGKLGWIHRPITVYSEGYMQYERGGDYLATVAQDFVLAADITWNTQFGTTGCGFVLRSDGKEEALNQYLVIATRGGNGRVFFAIQENGNVLTNEITDIYATNIDPLFDWQNDTTNRLAVVGRGNTFSIYTNGTLIGEVTPSRVYERGFLAFVALNESGTTTCHFDNAWLWHIN